jgi:O-antigen/teichoic acid export membrane protein
MSATPEHHTETVRNSISTNVMITIVARVVYLITRFFVPPFVLARVSLEAYGLWATAFILVSYIGISTMGLSAVYAKYVAEYSARGECRRANALLSTGLSLAIPLCAVLFGATWLFWPWVLGHLKITPALATEARVVVLIVIGSFLLSLCTSAFSDALTGVQKDAANQWIWIVAYLFETVLIFLLVGLGRGVRGLAEAFLLRTVLEEGLSTIVAFRKIPWLRVSPFMVNRESLRSILSFGGVVQITSFFSIGLNSIERVLAASFIGLQASGLLDLSKKLPSMAASIPNAFTSSLTPAASYLQGALEDTEASRAPLRKLFLKGARYMNLSAAYFYAFLAVAALPLLTVWLGKHYEGAALLATIFALATQVHLMTGPGTSVLKGLGRPKEEFYYCIPNVAALVVLVPLSRLAWGAWTAVGIGSAVALSTVLSAAFFIRHANRLLALPAAEYFRRVVLPGIVPYLVSIPLVVPMIGVVNRMNRWSAAVLIVLLGAVYTAVLALVVDRWVMDEGERLWFRAVIRSRLPRFQKVAVPEQEGAQA